MQKAANLFVGNDIASLLAQFIVLLVACVYFVFMIYRNNIRRVIILNHFRIVVVIILQSIANLGFYQLMISLDPHKGSGWQGLFIFGAFLATIPWKLIQYAMAFPLLGKNSIKDMGRSTDEMFNCNWPLIPRCANFALATIMIPIYIVSSIVLSMTMN